MDLDIDLDVYSHVVDLVWDRLEFLSVDGTIPCGQFISVIDLLEAKLQLPAESLLSSSTRLDTEKFLQIPQLQSPPLTLTPRLELSMTRDEFQELFNALVIIPPHILKKYKKQQLRRRKSIGVTPLVISPQKNHPLPVSSHNLNDKHGSLTLLPNTPINPELDFNINPASITNSTTFINDEPIDTNDYNYNKENEINVNDSNDNEIEIEYRDNIIESLTFEKNQLSKVIKEKDSKYNELKKKSVESLKYIEHIEYQILNLEKEREKKLKHLNLSPIKSSNSNSILNDNDTYDDDDDDSFSFEKDILKNKNKNNIFNDKSLSNIDENISSRSLSQSQSYKDKLIIDNLSLQNTIYTEKINDLSTKLQQLTEDFNILKYSSTITSNRKVNKRKSFGSLSLKSRLKSKSQSQLNIKKKSKSLKRLSLPGSSNNSSNFYNSNNINQRNGNNKISSRISSFGSINSIDSSNLDFENENFNYFSDSDLSDINSNDEKEWENLQLNYYKNNKNNKNFDNNNINGKKNLEQVDEVDEDEHIIINSNLKPKLNSKSKTKLKNGMKNGIKKKRLSSLSRSYSLPLDEDLSRLIIENENESQSEIDIENSNYNTNSKFNGYTNSNNSLVTLKVLQDTIDDDNNDNWNFTWKSIFFMIVTALILQFLF